MFYNFLNNEQTYLVFVDFFLSCSNLQVQNLSGHYMYAPKNLISQAFGKYILGKIYVIGSDLQLKVDSTFIYKTCGNIFEGNWKIRDRSLLLFVESNRWRNDSLNEVGFFGKHPAVENKNKPILFEIKNDGSLLGEFEGRNNGKRFKLIETLVKDLN